MLSMKAKYALRALMVLAKNEKKLMQTKSIAKEADVPHKFLEAILSDLKNHGLVTSKRGIFGGYTLSKTSDTITVGDIIRITDGPLAPIRCASVTAYAPCEDCPDEATCAIRFVMKDVREAISGVLDRRSLKEMLGAVKLLLLGGILLFSDAALAEATLNENGIKFTDEDGLAVSLKGYAQYDHRHYLSDDANAYHNNSTFRRVRPTLEITKGDFMFNFSPDLASSQGVIQDAYGEYNFTQAFSLRAGKFKAPIGLDVLKSDRDILFVERSLPSNLLPSRDIGLMAYGDIIPELSYDFGVFNGASDRGIEDSDQDDKKELAARFTVKPLEGLGTGIAATYGEKDSTRNRQVNDYRSPAQARVFRYSSGVFADGDHTRFAPFLYYYNGPLSVNAEYAISDQEVSNGTITESLAHDAWEVQLSYVLTGEDATYKGWPKPEESFNPLNGNFGAWEVATKYGELDIDDDAFAGFASATSSVSKEQNWGIALNGYLSSHVKLSLDFENTSFEGGAAAGDRETEHAILTRIQFKL